MAHAVVYTRVSTEEQAKTGLSLESQEKACKSFAESNGYEVLKVFKEEGASAKSADRKQLKQMLSYCAENKGRVDALIVWKVDRFARKTEDHLVLRAYLTKLGIKLLSVTEPIEDTNTGRLMETILAAFAQFDNEVRGERSGNGLKARMDEGGWVTYAPLGYRNVKDALGRPTLEVQPSIAKLIAQVFEGYSLGSYTQKQITNYAYDIGLRSRQSGGRLSQQTIVNMLRNVAYIGKRYNKDTHEAVKALHAPIISEDLFDEVQIVLDGKRTVITTKDKNWPLRAGFVRCADCKYPLTGSSPTNRSKKSYPKYSCPHCRASVTGKAVSIDRKAMHKEFADTLTDIRPEKHRLELFRRIVLLRWNAEHKELSVEKKRVNDDLSKLQDKRDRVMDLFIDGSLNLEEKTNQLEKIDSLRVTLRMQRSELEKEVDDREIVIDTAIDFMSNASRYWERAPLELQKRFQNLVFPDGIEYEFEKGFRTAKLGASYEVIQDLASEKPSVVGVAGLEPATKGL